MDTAVAETVGQILKIELEQYESYVEERLVNQTMPITDPIKRNNLHLLAAHHAQKNQKIYRFHP